MSATKIFISKRNIPFFLITAKILFEKAEFKIKTTIVIKEDYIKQNLFIQSLLILLLNSKKCSQELGY